MKSEREGREYIDILYLCHTPRVIASIPVAFDDGPYSTFMRWLEEDPETKKQDH